MYNILIQTVKKLPAMWETQVRSLGQEDPLEKGMAILSGEFHGQRNLVGYKSWGCKESGMTGQLTLHTSSYTYIYLSKIYLLISQVERE